MGIFDTIKCEYELPDKEIQDHDFQSKCLDGYMDRFILKKDGTLYKIMVETKNVDNTDWKEGDWEFFKTKYIITKQWEVKEDIHGHVRMYTSTGNHDNGDYKWWEYRLKFTNGKLVALDKLIKNGDEESYLEAVLVEKEIVEEVVAEKEPILAYVIGLSIFVLLFLCEMGVI